MQKEKCKICSKEYKRVTMSHIKKHNISKEEYLELGKVENESKIEIKKVVKDKEPKYVYEGKQITTLNNGIEVIEDIPFDRKKSNGSPSVVKPKVKDVEIVDDKSYGYIDKSIFKSRDYITKLRLFDRKVTTDISNDNIAVKKGYICTSCGDVIKDDLLYYFLNREDYNNKRYSYNTNKKDGRQYGKHRECAILITFDDWYIGRIHKSKIKKLNIIQ